MPLSLDILLDEENKVKISLQKAPVLEGLSLSFVR